jgi:hypothetical protein
MYEQLKIEGDDGICPILNRYLSRYYRIDNDFKSSLKEGYLWFSDPRGFNDPYDCNMSVNTDCTYEELYLSLHQDNSNYKWGVSDLDLRKRVEFLISNPSELKRLSDLSDLHTIETIGICCFSQRNDSLLMWSHYGDKHKGVCLTLDISEYKKETDSLLFNVEYPRSYPIFNWPKDKNTSSSLRHLIATKSQDWQYEDEVRIVRENINPPYRGKVFFNKKCLKSLYFGYKCEDHDIISITNLISQSPDYDHVQLFKAELKQQAFGLTYKSLIVE